MAGEGAHPISVSGVSGVNGESGEMRVTCHVVGTCLLLHHLHRSYLDGSDSIYMMGGGGRIVP